LLKIENFSYLTTLAYCRSVRFQKTSVMELPGGEKFDGKFSHFSAVHDWQAELL